MSQPILRVENLKKHYGDRLALEIPHLDFRQGEICALVGPNGAGKTTLLRMLNLLEQPTEGRLYFDETEIDMTSPNVLEARRQMTFVMQNPILFRTSVYRNVAYGLSVRSVDKKARSGIVLKALEMVGLSKFEHRRARQLSAGEAQRVALARALTLEPRVLFLDEPTANIDRRNVQVFESLIKNFNKEHKTTVIFTTHDLSQAYRLTDRVISLLDGRLISSSPENIFYGKIEANGDSKWKVNLSPDLEIAVAEHKLENIGFYMDPRDVIISLEPVNSDNWNCLKGHVTSITSENDVIRLTINVGVELVAIMDSEAFKKMDQNILNQSLYAAFEISNVHVF